MKENTIFRLKRTFEETSNARLRTRSALSRRNTVSE
jgi:hypothetical protein